jgi:hypothetical protein
MKIDAGTLAILLDVNRFTLYSMIQNGVITRYEEAPRKRQKYLFSEDDAAAAMITRDLMTFGLGRKQASEICDKLIEGEPFVSGAGVEISVEIEKYRDIIRSTFKKISKK